MRTQKLPADNNKITLASLAENLSGIKYKRMQVKNRQYIRNLLKTNQQLLKDNNINSLILF